MKNWKRALLLALCLLVITALLPTVAFAQAEIAENGFAPFMNNYDTANKRYEISIKGVDQPAFGETPDTTATVANDLFEIKMMVWQKYDIAGRFGKKWQVMKDDAKFAENGNYRCVFVVELASGARLPDTIPGLSATVNGQPAVIAGSDNTQIHVEMYYYFSEDGRLRGNYVLTFDANGGSGTMRRGYAYAANYYMLPRCTFTPPAGKCFRTWSVDGEEMDPGYIVLVSSDIKVTAIWADHTCAPKGVARVEPTCVAEGKEAYYHCDSCGRSYEDANGTKAISNVAAWGILAKVDVHTDGNGDGKCDACGHQKHICTLEGIAKVEPTCVAEGKEAYYKCYGCGKVFEDEKATKVISNVAAWGVLAKTDHTPSDWALDNKNHWKRCTVTGCGITIEGSREAHADGDGDGKCDACDYKMNKTVQNAGSMGTGEPTATTDDSGGEDSSATKSAEGKESSKYKKDKNDSEDGNSLWWLWLLLAVPAAGGIAALVFVLMKKKKQA